MLVKYIGVEFIKRNENLFYGQWVLKQGGFGMKTTTCTKETL